MDDDLGPLPRQHPRALVLEQARRALHGLWLDLCEKHKLTSAERTLLLAEMLSNFAARLVSIERRAEGD